MIRSARPSISEQAVKDILSIFQSGHLVSGPYVHEFEIKFSEYIGVEHGIATSNGTNALHATVARARVDHIQQLEATNHEELERIQFLEQATRGSEGLLEQVTQLKEANQRQRQHIAKLEDDVKVLDGTRRQVATQQQQIEVLHLHQAELTQLYQNLMMRIKRYGEPDVD
jgi:uncharacterized protein YgbK (DUF1537 family)